MAKNSPSKACMSKVHKRNKRGRGSFSVRNKRGRGSFQCMPADRMAARHPRVVHRAAIQTCRRSRPHRSCPPTTRAANVNASPKRLPSPFLASGVVSVPVPFDRESRSTPQRMNGRSASGSHCCNRSNRSRLIAPSNCVASETDSSEFDLAYATRTARQANASNGRCNWSRRSMSVEILMESRASFSAISLPITRVRSIRSVRRNASSASVEAPSC